MRVVECRRNGVQGLQSVGVVEYGDGDVKGLYCVGIAM